MAKKDSEKSFKKDLLELQKLKRSKISKIAQLLSLKNPTDSAIKKHIPDSFLRLLDIYIKFIKSDSDNISNKVKTTVAPLIDWINTNIPNIEHQPGFPIIVELISKLTHLDDDFNKKDIKESMAVINDVFILPWFRGDNLLPYLRVFLKNEDKILLDSSGDWDDWLYVIRRLMKGLEVQSDILTKKSPAWNAVDWEKINSHLSEIKKSIRTFEKNLKANNPKQVSKKKPSEKK